MELTQAPLGKLFRKYLFASLGSAVIMSIYAFVDAIAVGQAEGPDGSAAMAVLNPLFGVFVFLALVVGIGGSVLMSAARGEGNREEGDRWFSASLAVMGAAAVIVWAASLLLHEPLLRLFGADDAILPLVKRYSGWLLGFSPLVIAAIFLACFVRNDGDPGLAMRAVLIGGAFNVLGDWLLVFPLGLGITGAAIATITSNAIQTVVLCTHFFHRNCTLRLTRPGGLAERLKRIVSIGFGAGMLDLANVVLFALLNNQIMRYGGVVYLAVFGAAGTMSSLFQSLFSGVGQALQPIASTNFGAKEYGRVRGSLRYALTAALILGVVFFLIGICMPRAVVRLFMHATPETLAAAGDVIRPYCFVYLFMAVNVTATYYLQSTLRAKQAAAVSLLRGLIVSGAMILLLPRIFGLTGIWYAMPAAELIVCVLSLLWIRKGQNDRQ